MRAENLIAFTGAAGSGKTTRILADPRYEAVVAYTNAVAENAARRGEGRVKAQTVYKLLWPHLKSRHPMGPRIADRARAAAYATAPVADAASPTLSRFESDAPSRKPTGELDRLAKMLHGWEEGPPPFDLADIRASFDIEPSSALAFALTLGDFLLSVEGDPTRSKPYSLVAGDEWQDFSALEARVVLALADEVHGYGDPCQAIFSAGKGNPKDALPFGWRAAREVRTLGGGGHRCGDPLASLAAGMMRGWYDLDPASFRAQHTTEVLPWRALSAPPRGLVMGWRRTEEVGAAFRAWGLQEKWVRIGEKSEPDEEVVLATIHNAKGYEADDCYLLPWPVWMMKELARGRAEQRKLCYTALTRARRRVFVPPDLLAAIELAGR